MIEILSEGIRQIPHLESFIREELETYSDPGTVQAVAGWGHKESAQRAMERARQLGVPYLALEDGFLRSFDLGVSGAPPCSLSVDPCGCYYDARSESLIERLLGEDDWYTHMLRMRSQSLMDAIRSCELSKYNRTLPCQWEFPEGDNLLIIDQTRDDASLEQGLAPDPAEICARIGATVRRHYIGCNIYLKVHPDVAAGRRQGLLDQMELARQLRTRVAVIGHNFAPLSLLRRFSFVLTVTSQLGFEALLLGLKVHCFGMPFYAGYGLTADEGPQCPRRRACGAVSLDKLFAAAYLRLCRYVNPVTGERTEAEDIADLLALQRRHFVADHHSFVVYSPTLWKKKLYEGYLSNAEHVYFADDQSRALSLAAEHNATLVQWASARDEELMQKAAEQHCAMLFAEDGFVRSAGLGSDLIRPCSLVFDSRGIYYDPAAPSDLEHLLNHIRERHDLRRLRQRAGRLREYIVESALTKYNVEGRAGQEVLQAIAAAAQGGRRVLLVPGQVMDDASVRAGGAGITSNLDLLQRVRADSPGAFIIYKPHPDVVSRNRSGRGGAPAELKAACDLLVADVNIAALYDLADEVHVLSSLAGFEALLRRRRVVVYGQPFYAGWGLTRDLQALPRRRARLELDELVAGVLLLYPRYYDWDSGLFCRAEDICCSLTRQQGTHPPQKLEKPVVTTWLHKLLRLRRVF